MDITFHHGLTMVKSNGFFGSYIYYYGMLFPCSWQKVLDNITRGWGNHLSSNEFITRGLRPLVINFITFTRDYLNHSWYYPILFASYMGMSQFKCYFWFLPEDFWSAIFEWSFIKIITVVFSISTILTSPLLTNIAIFNSNKHYRYVSMEKHS